MHCALTILSPLSSLLFFNCALCIMHCALNQMLSMNFNTLFIIILHYELYEFYELFFSTTDFFNAQCTI